MQRNLSTSPRFRLASGRAAPAALSAALLGCAMLAHPATAAVDPTDRGYAFESADGSYLAGIVAGAEHDTAPAAAFLTQALRADPGNQDLLQRAFVADLTNGDMDQAFSAARDLARHDDTNALAQLALGVRDLAQKRYVSARQHFAKGGARSDLTTSLLTAWSYAGSGDYKRAAEALGRLTRPQFQVFRDYHEGLIAEMGGDQAAAREHLKAAYDADPNTLRVVEAWARFVDRTGDPAAAKRAYEALDQILPRHPLVQDSLRRLATGETLAPLVRTPQGGAAEVLFGLGSAGGQADDSLPALIYLRLANYLAPGDNLATAALADLLERLKQHQAAIAIDETIPSSSALSSNAEVQIALIEDETGHGDKATVDLAALASRRPQDLDALMALGNVQRAHKDFAAAAQTYTKALAAGGGASEKANWTLYYFRGIAEERTDHWPAAEADFKQALTLFPNQPVVLNYLGYSWVDKGVNLDAALKMLETAAQLRPEDGFIIDSLGWAYYKLGKYPEAERMLERAIQLEPGDAVVNEHLGDAYWRNGRKLEAHFQWNHARDFGPDKDDLPRILNEIAHGLPNADAGVSAQGDAKSGG